MIKGLISTLLSLVMVVTGYFGFNPNQIKSIKSVTKVEDDFYVMDYTFDYDIDEMLRTGFNSHVGLVTGALSGIMSGAFGLGFGCTTFNSVTSQGDYLLSRNFDYMDAPYLLLWTHPEDGYASVSSCSLAFCGYFGNFKPDSDAKSFLTLLAPYTCLDGVNEKGLSIGVLEVEVNPVFQISLKPNLTTTTMIRACLDKAATVDEAIEIFRSHDMRDFLFGGCSYHYQIADAKGDTCVIEYINGKMNVLRPENKGAIKYMCATNFILTEGVDDPDGMGQDRYDTVLKSLKKTGAVTSEKQAMNILKSTSMKDADLHGYICSTLWSVVYNCNDKTVKVCHNGNYNKTYSFSLSQPCKAK